MHMHMHLHLFGHKKKKDEISRYVRLSNSNIYGAGGPNQSFKMFAPDKPVQERLGLIYFQNMNKSNEKW